MHVSSIIINYSRYYYLLSYKRSLVVDIAYCIVKLDKCQNRGRFEVKRGDVMVMHCTIYDLSLYLLSFYMLC